MDEVKVAQSCLTLCNPWARTLEWVTFLFSKGSSQPRPPSLQADSLPVESQGRPILMDSPCSGIALSQREPLAQSSAPPLGHCYTEVQGPFLLPQLRTILQGHPYNTGVGWGLSGNFTGVQFPPLPCLAALIASQVILGACAENSCPHISVSERVSQTCERWQVHVNPRSNFDQLVLAAGVLSWRGFKVKFF